MDNLRRTPGSRNLLNALTNVVGQGSFSDAIPATDRTEPSIFVVDDQSIGRKVLSEIMHSVSDAARVTAFSDPVAALQLAAQAPPHLIVTDYRMPGMDGVAFTRELRALPSCADVPLVMVTIVDDRQIRYDALEAGATDFLTRPIDPHECLARCRNLLTMQHQQRLLKERASRLETQVERATREVRERERETLLRLAKAGEYRDAETGNHVLRMSRYARLLADELKLPVRQCEAIELAAPMHDIGKIGISDHVLLKPGKHTASETREMQRHTTIGHEILRGSPSDYLQLGAVIALSHHERWDGHGYPHGLAGEDIPLAARIVAVADTFDALISVRPYKAAWPARRAVAYIETHAGSRFDPDCVAAFVRRLDDVLDITRRLRDA